MSPLTTPDGPQCPGPWPGPVCVTCARAAPPVHGLVLVHGPGNVELLKCHLCGSTRDAFLERGPFLILLDLLLLHPPAYRHCLFNRFPLHTPAHACPSACQCMTEGPGLRKEEAQSSPANLELNETEAPAARAPGPTAIAAPAGAPEEVKASVPTATTATPAGPLEAAKAAELAPTLHQPLLLFLSRTFLTLLLAQGCLAGALRSPPARETGTSHWPTGGSNTGGSTIGGSSGPAWWAPRLGLELPSGHLPTWLLTSLLSYCCTLAVCFYLLLLFLRLSLGVAPGGFPQARGPRHSHGLDSRQSSNGPDTSQTSHSDPLPAEQPDQSSSRQPPRLCTRSPPDTVALAAVAALALALAESPKLLALGMLVWSYPPHLAYTLCGLCTASSFVSFSVLLSPLTGQGVWVASGLSLLKLCGELWCAGALAQRFNLSVLEF